MSLRNISSICHDVSGIAATVCLFFACYLFTNDYFWWGIAYLVLWCAVLSMLKQNEKKCNLIDKERLKKVVEFRGIVTKDIDNLTAIIEAMANPGENISDYARIINTRVELQKALIDIDREAHRIMIGLVGFNPSMIVVPSNHVINVSA